jgi:hypothetical protein
MEQQQQSEETGMAAQGEKTGGATGQDQARDDEENELEAEQESAAAMDADVPQPSGADQTTEGQPS